MDKSVEDCPVCFTVFDDAVRRPRTLPCGHTLCTPCINGLKEQSAVTCPTCRESHAAAEASQFPICYVVEGFVRRLRGAGLISVPPKPGKQAAHTPVTQPAPKVPAGLSRRAQSQLQEQETKVLAAIRSCQEEQSQLTDYLTTLGGWGGRQQKLEDELLTLVDQSKSAQEMVHREESRVEDRQKEVQQREQELHAALQTLRSAATRHEAYDAIEDTEHLVEEQNCKTEECLGGFPDVHAVTTIARVAEASHAALQAAAAASTAVSTTAAAVGNSSLVSASPMASIADKLKTLQLLPLTAEDLLSLTQPARALVEAGLVFAVQDVKGQSQHARISLEDDCLYLHSLQAQAPPPGAVTLQMEEVVPAAPPCQVFLDLAWPGSTGRRVVVSLPRDTPLGRQFMLLCLGQQGACYANTKLFSVDSKGEPGEWVFGGDYEKNNGKGGAALLPHLDQGEYWMSGKAGNVLGCYNDPATDAHFGIITLDSQDGVGDFDVFSVIGVLSKIGVFGEVVRGLEVVKEAAHHDPITEVIVAQCGVLCNVAPHTTTVP